MWNLWPFLFLVLIFIPLKVRTWNQIEKKPFPQQAGTRVRRRKEKKQ